MSTAPAQRATAVPNDLEAYWIPFTPNRAFKAAPRLIARAKDMHYYTPDGRAVLDGTAGMWCTNAGHNRDPIVAAIQAEAAELDYAPAFQFAHPKAFELASRVAALAPGDLDHVFFCNSGSEAVDTALKIALAYHNVRGEGARTRLIGRERGYHGVGFGGISVGGMVNNRKLFGALLAGVDHLPATYNREHQAFSKGEPEWGAHLADELERIVTLHDASTIAAVIVEPMAGSTGVLPAPKGYLPRLRAICDKHGILLVFDEVITGFGRLVRGRALRRRPRHDHVRQGHHLGQRAHGRSDRAQGHLRRVHARAHARGRALSRLHLFGASARLRGRARDARPLPRRAPVRARG
jgi:beta-alanine--pyruvate transaminase